MTHPTTSPREAVARNAGRLVGITLRQARRRPRVAVGVVVALAWLTIGHHSFLVGATALIAFGLWRWWHMGGDAGIALDLERLTANILGVPHEDTRPHWWNPERKVTYKLVKVQNLRRDDRGSIASFDVSYPSQTKAHEEGRQAALSAAYSHRLNGSWIAELPPGAHVVRARKAPPIPTFVPNRADILPDSPDEIPLAIGADGRVITWRLDRSHPHVFIVGPTGAGKSSSVMTGITQATLRDIDVRAVDINRELGYFRNYPGVSEVATEIHAAERLIARVHDEMEARYAASDEEGARLSDFPRLLLVIEEFVGFAGLATRKGSRVPALEQLRLIGVRGRRARVHLAICTQDPRIDRNSLPGGLRDQLGYRLALGAVSKDVRDIVGVSRTATPGIQGRCIVYGDEFGEAEAQAIYTPDPKEDLSGRDRAILAELRAAAEQARSVRPDDDQASPASMEAVRVRAEASSDRTAGEDDAGAGAVSPAASMPEAASICPVVTEGVSHATAYNRRGCRCVACRAWKADQNARDDSRRRLNESNGSRTKRVNPTPELRQEVYDHHAGICAWCGGSIDSDEAFEVDHQDGDASHTVADNLAPMHVACHAEKTVADRTERAR